MLKSFLTWGAALALFAVVFGAFGAHLLKKYLSDMELATWNTAVQYQFYHALAICMLSAISDRMPYKWTLLSGRFFVVGILLFSGSLYLLSCRDLLQLGGIAKIIGPITPIGGICFIIGWALLFYGAWISDRQKTKPTEEL
jgi:uncharacterized membrane protein YgdD (TMEM256/DUF423 family)